MKNYVKHHISGQILRVRTNPNISTPFVEMGRMIHESSEGQPLLRISTKPRSSRYRPHVGAKQKLKNTRRMLRDPKASLALHA